jgi:hypothetical protein
MFKYGLICVAFGYLLSSGVAVADNVPHCTYRGKVYVIGSPICIHRGWGVYCQWNGTLSRPPEKADWCK